MTGKMRWLGLMALATVAGSQGAWGATVSVFTDIRPTVNTKVFRDYNTADWNVSYNPAPAPVQNLSGGLSAWTYGAAALDPKINYADGAGAWDHAQYPWVRMRYKQSAAHGNVLIWEQPARGGEGITLLASTGLIESHGNPPNPNPNGQGYRIDPFNNAQAGDVFTADYVLVDTFETVGLGEWDAAGDMNGWTTANIGSVVVAAGAVAQIALVLVLRRRIPSQ